MSEILNTIDPFTNIVAVASGLDDQSGVFMNELRTINVGDGGNNVFRSDKQGIWLGASKFVTSAGVYAPFCVSMEGILRATGAIISGSITASTIDIGANGFHVDANGNMWWGSSTTYAGATIKISSAGSVAFTTGKIGSATNYWSIGANGLTAVAASGDVIINYGKTDFGQDSTAGFILGFDYSASASKFEIGSSASKLFKYDGTDFSLIGGVITGGTIQTSASTSVDRVVISGAENEVQFWNSDGGISAIIATDYNPANDMSGIEITAGGGTFLSLSGKSNMGFAILGANVDANNFGAFQVTWDGNDPSSLRLSLLSTIGGSAVDMPFDADILPYGVSNDIGASGNEWANLFVDSITLNGTARTTWPSAGITALSELSIDTAKAWGSYGITGLGTITPYSDNSYNLGSTSYQWSKIYTYDICSSGYEVTNAYIDKILGNSSANVIDLGNSGYIVTNQHFYPSSDNARTLGRYDQRWSDVRTVLINGADICLENGWKFREWPATKADVGKPVAYMKKYANKGIQILDGERLVAVIHKDGYIYCKGVRPLSGVTK